YSSSAFIVPGVRVELLAVVHRADGEPVPFSATGDIPVLAVDTTAGPDGQPKDTTVSVAVDRKQAKVLELVRARGGSLEVMIRCPDGAEQASYFADKLIDIL